MNLSAVCFRDLKRWLTAGSGRSKAPPTRPPPRFVQTRVNPWFFSGNLR
jgi:hypothetical protein